MDPHFLSFIFSLFVSFQNLADFFKSILSHLHLIFLSRISPLFTREKFKKLKCISWFFFSFNFPFLMVKVNKKKSVNNNNIFKVELEQLRSADKLLDNNLLTVSTCMCIEHVHTNRETLYEACFFYYFNRENERCSYICIYIYTIYIYILKTSKNNVMKYNLKQIQHWIFYDNTYINETIK